MPGSAKGEHGDVEPHHQPRLNAALLSLVQGVSDVVGVDGMRASGLLEALETLSQVGLSQASTDNHCPEEEPSPADPALASGGVGEIRDVTVAPSLWQKWVPRGLRERYPEWGERREPVKLKGRGVPEMPEAIRQAGGLKRTRDTGATGRAVVIPKNSEKCSMIFSCRAQNHADPRKPKGFKLPQIERIREKLLFLTK